MPNLSFDIFFNDDVVNLTASRSNGAPKVKPEWKVRTAPKLAPKQPVQPKTSVFAKPRIEEIEDAPQKPKNSEKPSSKASGKPAKLAPKK